jgi:hypothetical protein
MDSADTLFDWGSAKLQDDPEDHQRQERRGPDHGRRHQQNFIHIPQRGLEILQRRGQAEKL